MTIAVQLNLAIGLAWLAWHLLTDPDFHGGKPMLVLTIERGKTVNVDDVQIKVLSVRGGKVRLGFRGPPERRILREGVEPREPLPGPIQGKWVEVDE
jgi:carbon storage regulator CsrA